MRQYFYKVSIAVVALLFCVSSAFAEAKHTPYSEKVLADLESSGKGYLLDYYASWCITCRTQDKIIAQFQNQDPKFLDVTIVRVDWDDPASKKVIAANRIPRRSTLVVFKGKKELGRLVAGTYKTEIEKLLELGL